MNFVETSLNRTLGVKLFTSRQCMNTGNNKILSQNGKKVVRVHDNTMSAVGRNAANGESSMSVVETKNPYQLELELTIITKTILTSLPCPSCHRLDSSSALK